MKIVVFIFLLFVSQIVFAQKGDKFLINEYLITFPKKVKLVSVDKNSGAFAFTDKKNSIFQVSVRSGDKMEFYNSDFNQTELLEAFYRWEFDHWKANSIGAEVTEIRKEIEQSFILWKIKLKYKEKDVETIFLYGVKENKVISISIVNQDLSQENKETKIINLFKGISKY